MKSVSAALAALGALLFGSPGSAQARDVRPLPLTQATEGIPADSVCGRETACFDIRSGVAFSYVAHRLTGDGVIDTTWNADSSSCLGAPSGIRPAHVSDGGNGVIAAWVESRRGGTEIYATRVLSSGELAAGWSGDGTPVAPASASQSQLSVAPDGEGGAFVAWQEYRNGRDADLFLQRLGPNGTPASGWPSGGITLCAAVGEQAAPRLAADGSGGVIALWLDRREGSLGVYLQRIEASGAIASGWPVGGTPLAQAGCSDGQVLAGGSGSVWVSWKESLDGQVRLKVLRVNVSGSPAEGWSEQGIDVVQAAGSIVPAGIHALPGADLLVLWRRTGLEGTALECQRISAAGQVTAHWPQEGLLLSENAGSSTPAVLALSDTSLVVAWDDRRSGNNDIIARRIDHGTALREPWEAGGVAVCNAHGDQYSPTIRADGSGGVIVAWEDAGIETSPMALARRSTGLALVQLSEVRAMPSVVYLRWNGQITASITPHLYRQEPGGAWKALDGPKPNGTVLAYDDREVQPGTRAIYRLGLLERDIERMMAPIEVDVPLAPSTLHLSRVRFAAGEGVILASIALPEASSVQLELIDIAGRRVAARTLAGLEIGEHDVRFPVQGIRPGIFFLRARQAGLDRSVKFAIVR